MSYKTLQYEVREKIAYVIFNTPNSLNSITEGRLTELAEVVDELEQDSSLHGVLISGKGKAFCVGLDLELLKKAFEDVDYFGSVVTRLNKIIRRIEELSIPSIAMVNGFARAGGFEIALGCDLMLIADEAKIGDNHTHVGVMPGGGATQRLPKLIGLAKAKELIWTAKWLTGREAVDYGLALKSAPLEQLVGESEALLDQLRDKPRAVLSVVKRTMHDGLGLDLDQGIELEIKNFLSYLREDNTARDGFWNSLKINS